MYQKEKLLFHSNGNRIEAFLFISFVCFLRQLWQSFCHSQKAPLIAFQTNCPQKNVLLHTKAKNTNIWRRSFYFVCVRFYLDCTLGTCPNCQHLCRQILISELVPLLGKRRTSLCFFIGQGILHVGYISAEFLRLKPSVIFQEDLKFVSHRLHFRYYVLKYWLLWKLEKIFP